VDPNPTSHEGMVRCCLGGATGVLPSRTSRMVSNYDLAPDLNQVDILRVVVKENFAGALSDRLIADIVCIDLRPHYRPRSSSR